MGIFSWLKKDSADVELTSWSKLLPDQGDLISLFSHEVKMARQKGEIPFLLVNSSMSIDKGSVAIKKYRKKMQDAYQGVYIIEVGIDEWSDEDLKKLGFRGKFPYFAKIGTDGLPMPDILTGDVWGEDTLANMHEPITLFLKGQFKYSKLKLFYFDYSKDAGIDSDSAEEMSLEQVVECMENLDRFEGNFLGLELKTGEIVQVMYEQDGTLHLEVPDMNAGGAYSKRINLQECLQIISDVFHGKSPKNIEGMTFESYE